MSQCLLCSGALGREVFPFATRFNDKNYCYRACARCGSSTLEPIPEPDELAVMYRQGVYHSLYYAEQEENASTLLDLYLPHRGDERLKLLDFGCGNGQFLRQAKTLGFIAEGIELDPQVRLHAARESGCSVDSLEEVKQQGRLYNVIHLGDVLEHLPQPLATMSDLEDLLVEGGHFFIEGPLETNASLVRATGLLSGALRTLLGRRVVGSCPPYHLFQTNAQAQRAFFEQQLGYEVVKFDVWETGWPYRLSTPAQSTGARLRHLIGRVSIAAAAGLKPVAALGNRFAALIRPKPAQRVSKAS